MSGFFNMDSPVMRFLSRVCDLMILNFMCLICCIPIVTIGASVTALYSVTLKMVRGEESYLSLIHIYTEEYPPHTIPTISGRANSLTEETPSTNSRNTMIKVVSEV